jgi:hypothetical protein
VPLSSDKHCVRCHSARPLITRHGEDTAQKIQGVFHKKRASWRNGTKEYHFFFKIRGLHAGDYEECRLLGCGAVYILRKLTFRRNVSPQLFYPQDGGDKFLRNVGLHNVYTASHPRRRHSSTEFIFDSLPANRNSHQIIEILNYNNNKRSFYFLLL